MINGKWFKAETGVSLCDLFELFGRGRRFAAEPDDHPADPSRGGPSAKIHLACGWHDGPLTIGGNTNDRNMFDTVSVGVWFP